LVNQNSKAWLIKIPKSQSFVSFYAPFDQYISIWARADDVLSNVHLRFSNNFLRESPVCSRTIQGLSAKSQRHYASRAEGVISAKWPEK